MILLLYLHIAGGSVALLAGAVALAAPKGRTAHRQAGILFAFGMVILGTSGALIAAFDHTFTSVVAGLLAAYLVVTGVSTLRPAPRRLEVGLMLGALALGIGSLVTGSAVVSGFVPARDMPVPIFFVFGTVALVGGAGDLRVLRTGPIRGTGRLTRHLWRMCLALWIASASFFLGQAQLIPESLRIFPLLMALAVAPLVVMLYWLWRVRLRGLALTGDGAPTTPPEVREPV
jgi:hypothetical protein